MLRLFFVKRAETCHQVSGTPIAFAQDNILVRWWRDNKNLVYENKISQESCYVKNKLTRILL